MDQKTSKLTVQDICLIAIVTAVVVVMAQISIPMPAGVPMTMQTFAVTLAGILLGSKKGAISLIVYLLLGFIGLPVFSGFTGGAQALINVTGGFLLSFPIMAYLIGLGTEHRHERKGMFLACLVLGTVVNYIIGTVMFCLLTGSSAAAGFTACVLPFIPTAVIKAVLAAVLGLNIQKRLSVMSYSA